MNSSSDESSPGIDAMRPLKRWEKNYCGTDDPETITSIFRKRHKTAGILFLGAFAGNPLLMAFCKLVLGLSNEEYMAYGMHYLNLALPVAAFYILFRYRCPRCNAIPKSNQLGTGGVLLFPKRCGNCGAPLLPHHRWAQN
jgi:hypothetical protein